MSNPGRNDPCPCGSGKKYKKCCWEKDDAMRDLAGFPSVTKFDAWQVELVPMPARIENEPDARLVVPFIMADGFLLPTEPVNRPPADPDGAAGVLENALRTAAETTGRLPDTVEVRHPRIALALEKRLEPDGVKVRRVEELPELQEAARGFVARTNGGGVIAGAVEIWSGWGLAHNIIAELFGAAAAFYRAAPWVQLENDDLIMARYPDGKIWYICVLGNGGETFGIDLIEDQGDFELMMEGNPGCMNEMFAEVIACLFDGKGHNPPRMIAEIRREKWEVAGPAAYPSIIAINTPAYGVSEEHALNLTTAMKGIPGFVAAWQATPPPEESDFPVLEVFCWRDPETGVVFEMPDFR